MNFMKMSYKNKQLYHQYRNEFNEIFKLDLKDYITRDFITLVAGFDVIKFDADLKTPDGISTYDFIGKKYGKRGIEIIKILIV